MTLFHIDIILYLIFIVLNTYNNKEEIQTDLKASLFYFAVFSFCIFVVLLAMIKEFPVPMFFFICFALMRATRQFFFKEKK
jgi:hypothetical protein